MLDSTNTNLAYRFGRLFAVLEKIQEESAGGTGKLNATIRDRYFGAARSRNDWSGSFRYLRGVSSLGFGFCKKGLALVVVAQIEAALVL